MVQVQTESPSPAVLHMRVMDCPQSSRHLLVACQPSAAAHENAADAGWRQLLMRVSHQYPQQPPELLFATAANFAAAAKVWSSWQILRIKSGPAHLLRLTHTNSGVCQLPISICTAATASLSPV